MNSLFVILWRYKHSYKLQVQYSTHVLIVSVYGEIVKTVRFVEQKIKI